MIIIHTYVPNDVHVYVHNDIHMYIHLRVSLDMIWSDTYTCRYTYMYNTWLYARAHTYACITRNVSLCIHIYLMIYMCTYTMIYICTYTCVYHSKWLWLEMVVSDTYTYVCITIHTHLLSGVHMYIHMYVPLDRYRNTYIHNLMICICTYTMIYICAYTCVYHSKWFWVIHIHMYVSWDVHIYVYVHH